jgi:hypothetical protein
MAIYDVTLTRELTESVVVHIEAESRNHAIFLGRSKDVALLDFQTDSDTPRNHRVSDCTVKKGNKEYVVPLGEKLEEIYELIEVTQNEAVFRNGKNVYKINNIIGK